MRNVLRRHVKTFYLAGIVLAVAVWMPACVPSAYAASSWEDHPAHHAVWRLADAERTRQASAFAVGPRLIVTVAHTLFNMAQAGASEFVIDQAGRDGHIKVARTRSISATHDLALLETATPMEHHLTVARALPHGLADQFHAAGYPRGRFQILSVIVPTIHGDADYYSVPVDRVVQGGMSGAPLLAPNGEAVAMFRTSESNVAGAVRLETLNDFLRGEVGVACGAWGFEACLGEATRRTKRLAEGGDIAAQFQLGRGDRYVPRNAELRWLRRAAEGGHSSAQRAMGNALCDGARGLQRDWKRSNYWLHLAAEQEDPVSQLNLSVAYFYGEGLTRDESKALEWLHRALRNGYVGAEYNLGVMYYDGDGLPIDKELGRYWLQRAAARGDEDAQKILAEE